MSIPIRNGQTRIGNFNKFLSVVTKGKLSMVRSLKCTRPSNVYLFELHFHVMKSINVYQRIVLMVEMWNLDPVQKSSNSTCIMYNAIPRDKSNIYIEEKVTNPSIQISFLNTEWICQSLNLSNNQLIR